MKDYYSLLGLERTATKAEIKKNYRLLATKFHPDKNSSPNSAEKFIAIMEAYEVLSNKKSKAQYDLLIWQEQKRKKESTDYFTVNVPTPESTRTRKNKSQQKRSIKYHQAKSETKKLFQLVMESFHIISRYVLHLLGIPLLILILSSLLSHLSDSFEKGIFAGVFISIFIAAIIYCIFEILKNFFIEYKKDLESFSVFYKISQKNATTISISIFALVLLLYIIFLKAYF